MRRSEKEITDRTKIDEILNKATVCRIAFAKENRPYIIPVSYGFDGEAIYFHCFSGKGLKLEYIRANKHVCFEMEHGVELVPHKEKACNWSFSFQSVIGFGVVEELVDEVQKIKALQCIMQQYSTREFSFEGVQLGSVGVYKIIIESLTGKQSANFKD